MKKLLLVLTIVLSLFVIFNCANPVVNDPSSNDTIQSQDSTITGDSTGLTSYYQINGGSWQQGTSVTVSVGNTLKFGPNPTTGTWSWWHSTMQATTREITITVASNSGGIWYATHTSESNKWLEINVTVSGSGTTTTASGTTTTAAGSTTTTASGSYADCIAILKSYGISNLRLRNWTKSGWCDTSHNNTLKSRWGSLALLSVHFSDSWADPGKQTIPSGWPTDYAGLKSKVTSYMQSTCSASVKQIGNETNDGMLWPVGKASTNPSQYAGLVAAGKSGGGSLVHVSNGWDTGLHSWNFGILSSNGVSVSRGMSIYDTSKVSAAVATKNKLGSYTVCEVGCARGSQASYISSVKAIGTTYYWEPQGQGYQGYTMDQCDPNTKKFTATITSGKPNGVDITWLPEMESAGYKFSY